MEEKEKEKGREERKKGGKEKEKGREERKRKRRKEKGRGRRKKEKRKHAAAGHLSGFFFFLLNNHQGSLFRGNPLSGQRNPFKGGGCHKTPLVVLFSDLKKDYKGCPHKKKTRFL